MGKEQFREADTTRKVVGVKFTAGSSELIRQAAHLQIFSNRLYEDVQGKWQPAPFGPLDTRLGTFQQAIMCSTCGLKLDNCVGHFGFIDLEYPVFHVGFFRLVIQTLQCICKACSRTLLQGEQKEALLRQALTPNLDYLRKKALHKRMLALSKKCTLCAHCGLLNGVVKKAVGAILKIAHAEPIGAETVTDFVNAQQRGSGAEGERQREVGQLMGSAKYNLLDPLKVLDIFRKIDAKDIAFLMIGSDECKHPVNFLTQRIPVPPVCIRPSVVSVLKSGSNEDDLTMKLTEIMLINDILKKHKRDGAPMKTVAETWDHLQIQCALYINSELSGLPPEMQPKKFLRSFAQRLKGKEGRFRGNLSGKRVDFSGRTVISPDPNLKIDQVGVPRHIATTLTFPEVVCRANIELMRQLVRNGDSVHPGANLYIDKTGFKRFLRFGNREKIARDLQIGDIVERHLNDDDVVLFNRQPSLHKISIMAHRVKVMPHRTFRFNECACTPYNADFDGDEMNLHLPQTYEAKAEASLLMGLKSNLVSPRAGQPLIAAIQDFITSGYLLTHKDTFLPRSEVQRIASAVVEANNGTMGQRRVHLPPPAMLRPKELWTGKQLIELLIAPFQGTEVRLNLATKNRMHNPDEGEFTQNDTFVIIRNNQLLCGALDKALLGSESKCSIFYRLLRDWGEQHAIDAMWRLARISSIYLSNRGFSIGIGDVKPNANLLKEKSVLLSEGYKICDQLNKSMRLERQKDKPDLGVVEQLESKILKELSSIRDQAGKACKQYLSRKNAPLTMAQCGSKGSFINIAQMIALVGQQSISGKRPSDGFEMRSLPHFERNDRAPDAKGFVENSFFSGLTPTEFFFHTMGGREGLVDTAVKTAETGYMQRRLVKCLEDLAVNYDNTVRTSTNEVVQFTFGDDGLDPAYMEGKDGRPLDLPHVLAQVRNNSNSSMAGVSSRKSDTGSADVYEFGSLAELEDAIRAEIVHRMEVVVAGEGISTEWVEATARKKQQQQNCVEETRTVQQQYHQHPRITAQFGDELMKFFSDQFTRNLRILHTSPSQCQRHTGLMSPTTRSGGQSSRCKDCEPIAARRRALLHSGGFSIGQLRQFLDICAARVRRGTVEPGTAVGAIAATSIGEPSTQMTLKTFHFAGVASMNITQGVPRIKEIINAVRSISTPIITVALADEKDEKLARRVKARIERTTLGDICDYVEQVFLPDDLFVLVKLNTRRIRALQLEVTMDSIIGSICTAKLPVPRIMFDQVRSVGKSMLLVRPVDSPKCSITMYMHYLKYYLPSVVVKGLAGINRCVINADEKRGDSFQLFVEGTNFKEVLALTEINGVRTKFNNPLVIAEVLGIESARGAIISEILTTMGEHGIELDRRHVQLLADLMTYRGQVLGITRDGLVKMKESVLLLASFERTIDHLYEAAFFGQQDRISGVSECIIMGTPMGIGTGMFKLLQNQKPIRVKPIDRILVKEEPSVTRKQVKSVQHTSQREIKREITGDDELQQHQQQQQHVEEVSAPPPIPLQRQPIFELDELDIVI